MLYLPFFDESLRKIVYKDRKIRGKGEIVDELRENETSERSCKHERYTNCR